jgi:hypothetical protein
MAAAPEEDVPHPADLALVPSGLPGEEAQLQPPRSQYTMSSMFNIWPEEIQLSGDQLTYEHMPENVIQMFRDFRIKRNRYIVACRYQAEICPKTRKPHIQFFIQTSNKRPTTDEVLFYLEKGDRNAIKVIHPDRPRNAALYCNKENSRMPGAEPQGWGELPPDGEYPKAGGKRENSGRNSVTLEEYHQMVKLSVRPQREFLMSPFGRKLKVKEVWDMINAKPRVTFKGVHARRYISITWQEEGDLGKSTMPFLWAEEAGEEICKAPVADGGVYGRWLDGFDHQRCLLLNEFSGNWVHGFHDFLDFLDFQFTRLMEVKRHWVVVDFEFVFINSNYDPDTWIWYFPEEKHTEWKGYRTLNEKEKKLLKRRLRWGEWAGCGCEEWDASIPKERSNEQPFLYSLWFIRQMEEGAEPPPKRLRTAFPQTAALPQQPAIPLPPAPNLWPVPQAPLVVQPPPPLPLPAPPPPPAEVPAPRQIRRRVLPDSDNIFEVLQQLQAEENDDRDRWMLNRAAQIEEPEDVTDTSVYEGRLMLEDDQASLEHPAMRFFSNEAEEVSD